MTDQEREELAALRQQDISARKALCLIKARIAELEGKPAEARFERMCAGQEPYDHGVYIAMRAEEYPKRGGHYAHDSAEDRAAVEMLLGLEARAIPSTVQCSGCDNEYSSRPVVPHEHDLFEPSVGDAFEGPSAA